MAVLKKEYISIQKIKTAFHTSSERIARVTKCIEPYFSLRIYAKPELAHCLQTSEMPRNSTLLKIFLTVETERSLPSYTIY